VAEQDETPLVPITNGVELGIDSLFEFFKSAFIPSISSNINIDRLDNMFLAFFWFILRRPNCRREKGAFLF